MSWALRVSEAVDRPEDITLQRVVQTKPDLAQGQVLVRVAYSSVNPSDAKACLGLMPSAAWPRIPGRDFSGVVVEGAERGMEVWGSGGDIGISRDGAHASYLVLPERAIVAKPQRLTLLQAGTVGVPFVTAFEGFQRAGGLTRRDRVLVLGANGKVGQAAMQIGRWQGGDMIGVARRGARGVDAANDALIDHTDTTAAIVRERWSGHGADIVFNTVGSPYFALAVECMAKRGRQILISTIDKRVDFDIFGFYRGMHAYFGVDTLALNVIEASCALGALTPGFESGALTPFDIEPSDVRPLGEAATSYREVLAGTRRRLALSVED